MLRPERLQVLAPAAADAAGLNCLHARVIHLVYQGDTFLLQARLGNGSAIHVRGIAGAAALSALPAAGEVACLAFGIDDTVLLADTAT
jgi:putative spermidine/putrescine transport system ATP-binding protein